MCVCECVYIYETVYAQYIYIYTCVCPNLCVCVYIRYKHNCMKIKYIYIYPTHHPPLRFSVTSGFPRRLVIFLQALQPRTHVLKHLVSLADVGFEAFLLQLLDVLLVGRDPHGPMVGRQTTMVTMMEVGSHVFIINFLDYVCTCKCILYRYGFIHNI